MIRPRILISIKNAGECGTSPAEVPLCPAEWFEIDLSQRFAGRGRSVMVKIDGIGGGSMTSIIQVVHMEARSRQTEMPTDEEAATLTISPEKVCFIIIKAREFDAKG
jgi:hypothetical protein